MAMTPRCDVLPMSGAVAIAEGQAVTDRMSAFLAEELLPLMAGLWPAGANQLDGNAGGAALAFGLLLQGLTPAQIRAAVMSLAVDPARKFPPTPAELRAMCMAGQPSVSEAVERPVASLSSLRMIATVKQLRGEIGEQELDSYVAGLVSRYLAEGFEVSGRGV